ncbi:MAG: hypothetical protein KAJ93_02390 [Methanosarcinales archaeon]|nr:hypothetical protein [Methanosarcinales archaeon]
MVNLGTIGELIVVIRADDAEETNRQISKVQETTKKAGQESKRQIPVLERMGKRWGAVLGLVAASGAVAFGLIVKSTPAIMGSLKGMQLGFESILNVIGEELSPVFEVLSDLIFVIADAFDGLSPNTKTFIAGLVGAGIILSALAAGVLAVSLAVPVLTTALATSGVALGPLLLVIGLVTVAFALLYTVWKNNLFGIQDKVRAFVAGVVTGWKKLMSILGDESLTTKEKILKIWGIMKTNIGIILTAIKDKASEIWQSMKDKASEVFTSIKDSIVSNFASAKSSVVEILESIKTALRNTINYFKDNPITKFIKRVTTSVSPGALSGTPARANGGPVASGTQYLVGERGPELFTPNLSGAIIPNNKLASAAGGQGKGTQAPINLNVNMKLDGRTVWQSVQKYSTAELRRMGA